MARFPSERFRAALSASGEVVAVVEFLRGGEVALSSEEGDFVVEDGQVTFDLTRNINADFNVTILIPGGPSSLGGS